MASLKPNMSSMLLSYTSQVFLGLMASDEKGESFYSPLIRNHGFRKIPNPFNWDSDACSFVENIDIYPDVLRVPLSLDSQQTLIFIGFTVREAENLWERQQICNQGRGQYTLLRLALKYLKESVEDATSLEQVVQIGFNPSSPNTGFFPGVGYRSGIPSLPVIDVERPADGSKLIDWCYWITYRRFCFLLYLEPMLRELRGDGPDRHPLEMWEIITASFKRPAEAKDCPSFDIEIPENGDSNSGIAGKELEGDDSDFSSGDLSDSEVPDQETSYQDDENIYDEDEIVEFYGEKTDMEVP
ncbi:hypothetical protein MMC31_004140 [Peltigera leucophlebia]|nr:hypothetical protein [Peltigera leucophlebia]